MDEFKPKLRIQTREKNGALIKDRLVDQYNELLYGPKEPHDGPITLEVTLSNASEYDKLIEYLNKLRGQLPIDPVKVSKLTKHPVDKIMRYQDPYTEILDKVKKAPDMESVIDMLWDINYKFLDLDLLEELQSANKLTMNWHKKKSKFHKKYQYMTRLSKIAKDPANDKYDFKLMFGIKYVAGRNDKIVIYQNEKYLTTIRKEWRDMAGINMKKKKVPMVFPDYMTIDERKKWRAVDRKITTGSTRITGPEQKFYDRHLLEIRKINPHYFSENNQ